MAQPPRENVPVDILPTAERTGALPFEDILFPAPAVGSDSSSEGAEDRPRYPLDDPFFPGFLLREDIAPGFVLGETSLADGMEERANAPESATRSEQSQSNPGIVEELRPDQKRTDKEFSGSNLLAAPPGVAVRRTAMSQAWSTGDSILGNLGSLRGSLASPFIPIERREAPPFRIGLIGYSPHANVGLVADHYRDISNRDGKDHFGGFLQAGVEAAIQEERRISGELDYTIGISTPTGSSGEGDIKVDQHLDLELGFAFPQLPKMRFGFELDYAQLSGVDRDIGTNVTRALATGTFLTSYAYSRKTRIDWDVSVPVREFNGGFSSEGVTTTLFVNNQITRKTQVGMGISVGMLKIQGGSDQWFQQLLFRANYDPAGAWTFDTNRNSDDENAQARLYVPSTLWTFGVTAGLEFREAGGSLDLSPIFGLGVNWKPYPGTLVSLAGESRVFNSASVLDANYRSTSVSLAVKQRIGYRLTASLSFGYENAVYDGGLVDGRNGRTDNLFEASIGLHLPVTKRWSWELILSAGKNESDVVPLEFYQGVLQTSYQF